MSAQKTKKGALDPGLSMDEIFLGIQEGLHAHADPQRAAKEKYWNKNPDFQALGISRDAYILVFRAFKPHIVRLSLEERMELAQRLVRRGYNEQAGMANSILVLSTIELTPLHFNYLSEHVRSFHSWGPTDGFCIDILQPLLWHYTDETLALLRTWNRSPNPWHRRASVVAFTRKAGASGSFTRPALELCENLLADQEYYVQMGVGWALKDVMRGEKAPLLAYIKGLRSRGVPSVITLYAIRDLKGAERRDVLNIKPELT